jgi:hypothetical protein
LKGGVRDEPGGANRFRIRDQSRRRASLLQVWDAGVHGSLNIERVEAVQAHLQVRHVQPGGCVFRLADGPASFQAGRVVDPSV